MPQNQSLPDVDQPTREIYRTKWRQIRTRFNRNRKVQDLYNFRINTLNTEELNQQLTHIFQEQRNVFRLNVSFGFVLRNNETGETQYYHASHNNGRLFDEPFLITNAQDMERLYDDIKNIDIMEWAKQKRPNSKWIVTWVTNVCFYVTKIQAHPIGSSTFLPAYILNNKGLVGLDCDDRTGKAYTDKLCFFRSLALHNGCDTKNLERDTKHYFERLVVYIYKLILLC